MSIAMICGLLLTAAAAAVLVFTIKSHNKAPDERLGMVMLSCVIITLAAASFHVGEFPGERKERAKECLDKGYAVDLNGHEIFSGSVDLDLFTVTAIDDENEKILIISNSKSPEWASAYND